MNGFVLLKAKLVAEVSRYGVLHCQVVLEFVIIFDDHVTTSLELMDERAGALGLMWITFGVGQKICAILARAERTAQSAAITHLQPVQNLRKGFDFHKIWRFLTSDRKFINFDEHLPWELSRHLFGIYSAHRQRPGPRKRLLGCSLSQYDLTVRIDQKMPWTAENLHWHSVVGCQ